MTKRRKKSLCRIVGLALAAVFLMNTPALEVSAAADEVLNQGVEVLEAEVSVLETDVPMTRTMFASNKLDIGADSQGLVVEAVTWTTAKASVLGVKDIKIYKKMWYGWKEVATSSGGEALDCVSMSVTVHYANAEKGETYKATCVHYGNVDGYAESEHESRTFKYE